VRSCGVTDPPTRTDRSAREAVPAGSGSADAALVALLVARDGEALDALYARYGRPAYSLAYRITRDEGFAEDVVQEVFLALWRNPERYDPSRGFASWLLSMTHHKAVDAVRREESLRRRRDAAAEETVAMMDEPGAGSSVDEEVWAVLRGERVREVLRGLPAAQREALALAYFGGYTQREVAVLTDTPLGTVKTRMLAGMRRMRESLGRGLLEGGAGL
jgi:RNA polymerase sigma-70 factor (ECF subfamily)